MRHPTCTAPVRLVHLSEGGSNQVSTGGSRYAYVGSTAQWILAWGRSWKIIEVAIIFQEFWHYWEKLKHEVKKKSITSCSLGRFERWEWNVKNLQQNLAQRVQGHPYVLDEIKSIIFVWARWLYLHLWKIGTRADTWCNLFLHHWCHLLMRDNILFIIVS